MALCRKTLICPRHYRLVQIDQGLQCKKTEVYLKKLIFYFDFCIFFNSTKGFNFDDDPADIDAIIGKPKSNETKPAKQISFETEKKPSYNQLSSTMPASGSYAPSSAKTGLKSSIFDDIEDTGLLGILSNYILNKK